VPITARVPLKSEKILAVRLGARETEVDDHRALARAGAVRAQQHVVALEVAVDDASLVGRGQPGDQLLDDRPRALGRELAGAPQPRLQRLALEQLHGQEHRRVVAAAVEADVEHAAHVGVRHAAGELHLALSRSSSSSSEIGPRLGILRAMVSRSSRSSAAYTSPCRPARRSARCGSGRRAPCLRRARPVGERGVVVVWELVVERLQLGHVVQADERAPRDGLPTAPTRRAAPPARGSRRTRRRGPRPPRSRRRWPGLR